MSKIRLSTKLSTKAKEEISIRYRPPDIPMSAIRRYARQVADRFHPERIVLFGSYAYGKPHQNSDVDLLVVMPAASETAQAIRITLSSERPFPLDLIVRTPHSLRRALADGNWFLQEVMDKGKVLYEKGNRPLDSKGRRGLQRRQESGQGYSVSQGFGLFPLSASRRKVSKTSSTRIRVSRPSNSQSG